MSATAINQVRIYQAALPEEQVQQQANRVVHLLALGLVRSLAKRPDSRKPVNADQQEPATSCAAGGKP